MDWLERLTGDKVELSRKFRGHRHLRENSEEKKIGKRRRNSSECEDCHIQDNPRKKYKIIDEVTRYMAHVVDKVRNFCKSSSPANAQPRRNVDTASVTGKDSAVLDILQTPPSQRKSAKDISTRIISSFNDNVEHATHLASSRGNNSSRQSTNGQYLDKTKNERIEECCICTADPNNTIAFHHRPNSVLAGSPIVAASAVREKTTSTTLYNVFRLAEKNKYAELLEVYTNSNTSMNVVSGTKQQSTTKLNLREKARQSFDQSSSVSHIEENRLWADRSCAIRIDNRIQFPRPSSKDEVQLDSRDAVLNVSLEASRSSDNSRSSKHNKEAPYGEEWFAKWKKRIESENRNFVEAIRKHTENLKNINIKKQRSTQETIDQIEDLEKDELNFPALFPELDNIREKNIDFALYGGQSGQVLAEEFNLSITRSDIRTLEECNWLNDEVINFYFNLIARRSKQEVDIFSYNILLIPIHLGVHWCLAVIDFRTKEIKYYDSMLGNNQTCVNLLLDYLCKESVDKLQKEFDSSSWKTIIVKDIPQQMNGSDCGVFACKFADCISRNMPLAFEQEDMPYFRRLMIYEIVNKELL